MSALSGLARVAWVASGITWALRSAMVLAHPAYMDPVTPFDWLAVVGFSAGFVLVALAILVSGALTPTRASRRLALSIAGASLVAGIANLLEDGGGVDAMFGVFAISGLIALYGSFVIAGVLLLAGRIRLAGWWAGWGLGLFVFPIGASVLALVMALVLAVRSPWLLEGPVSAARPASRTAAERA